MNTVIFAGGLSHPRDACIRAASAVRGRRSRHSEERDDAAAAAENDADELRATHGLRQGLSGHIELVTVSRPV